MGKTVTVFFTLLILCALCSGCMNANTKSSDPIPDPEEGLRNVVDAMNQKDAAKLFDLYDEELRTNASMDYVYNSLHEGPGPVIINYTVLDKEIKGNKAWLNVRFIAELPDSNGEIKPTPYTQRVAFVLEDNQWKMSEL